MLGSFESEIWKHFYHSNLGGKLHFYFSFHRCNNDAVVQNKENSEVRKTPTLLEGVKLRRKKFSSIIQKPLSLAQRQSMHITAGLQDHLRKGLTEEKRRHSMPRLLDDSEDEEDDSFLEVSTNSNLSNNLVRSPSDTSLLYLNQLSSSMLRQRYVGSN